MSEYLITKANGEKVKFLIVDDSLFMRNQIREIITDFIGGEVIAEAEDGKKAVEYAITFKPDIVTLDLTMPVLDGVSALKELKKNNVKSAVIIITALGHKEKVKECIINGAVEYVVKPFDYNDVSKKINNVIKNYILAKN